MKEETLAVWYEGRNCYYPVEMSQSFPHQVFFSGVAAGPRIPSVFSCHFLFPSLSSLCVSLLSSLPPPCLLLCWGCLLSQTRGVKSSSILTPPPLSSIYCMGVKINNTPFSDLTHLIWHLIQSWVICRGDINEFFHAPAPHLLFCCVPPLFSGSRAIYMRSELT